MDDGLARLVLQRRWSADRRGDGRRKHVDDCHRQVSAPPPNIKSSLLNFEKEKEGTYQILEAFSARRTRAQSVIDLPPMVTRRGQELGSSRCSSKMGQNATATQTDRSVPNLPNSCSCKRDNVEAPRQIAGVLQASMTHLPGLSRQCSAAGCLQTSRTLQTAPAYKQ